MRRSANLEIAKSYFTASQQDWLLDKKKLKTLASLKKLSNNLDVSILDHPIQYRHEKSIKTENIPDCKIFSQINTHFGITTYLSNKKLVINLKLTKAPLSRLGTLKHHEQKNTENFVVLKNLYPR